jgi:hypothetical protein
MSWLDLTEKSGIRWERVTAFSRFIEPDNSARAGRQGSANRSSCSELVKRPHAFRGAVGTQTVLFRIVVSRSEP